MSAWRREALATLPELRSFIVEAPEPMALWIDLHIAFENAMHAKNTSLADRLLRYAAWCFSARSGVLPNNTSTAVACAFYEHLPCNKEFWPSFSAWFSVDEFTKLLPVFAYHVSPEDLEALKVVYRKGRPNQALNRTRLRRAGYLGR